MRTSSCLLGLAVPTFQYKNQVLFEQKLTRVFCWSSEYFQIETSSSWLNWALRDDEAVYWVRKGHLEAVADGNW